MTAKKKRSNKTGDDDEPEINCWLLSKHNSATSHADGDL